MDGTYCAGLTPGRRNRPYGLVNPTRSITFPNPQSSHLLSNSHPAQVSHGQQETKALDQVLFVSLGVHGHHCRSPRTRRYPPKRESARCDMAAVLADFRGLRGGHGSFSDCYALCVCPQRAARVHTRTSGRASQVLAPRFQLTDSHCTLLCGREIRGASHSNKCGQERRDHRAVGVESVEDEPGIDDELGGRHCVEGRLDREVSKVRCEE
jgi:hypothetical protein